VTLSDDSSCSFIADLKPWTLSPIPLPSWEAFRSEHEQWNFKDQ
jgi:hypothetical protein